MVGKNPTPLWRRGVVLGPVLGVIVIALMLLSTTFVPLSQQAAAADTAVEYADLNYESVVVAGLTKNAQPLAELATKMVADPAATGEESGRREDETKPYSFAVTATGKVAEGDFGEMALEVEGMPEGITVGVAIPPLGSSTALRDAGTELDFGSFVNQTEYQNVAIELNKRAAEAVYGDLDLSSKVGQEITVTGAMTWTSKTGSAVTHITIIPVAIEAGA